MLCKACLFRFCFFRRRKLKIANMHLFFKMGSLIAHFVFFHLRHVQKNKNYPGSHVRVLGSEMGPSHSRTCVVCVCGVVCVVECRMRVHGVFCGVSLGGTMRSAISVLLEKPASVIFLMPMPLGVPSSQWRRVLPRNGPFTLRKYL